MTLGIPVSPTADGGASIGFAETPKLERFPEAEVPFDGSLVECLREPEVRCGSRSGLRVVVGLISCFVLTFRIVAWRRLSGELTCEGSCLFSRSAHQTVFAKLIAGPVDLAAR